MTNIHLRTLHIAIHLIFRTTLQNKYNYCDYSHFEDQKVEDEQERNTRDGT